MRVALRQPCIQSSSQFENIFPHLVVSILKILAPWCLDSIYKKACKATKLETQYAHFKQFKHIPRELKYSVPLHLSFHSPIMTSDPILLIFGCKSNIGASVAEAYKRKGYNPALVSRSIDEATSTSTELYIKPNFQTPVPSPKSSKKRRRSLGVH